MNAPAPKPYPGSYELPEEEIARIRSMSRTELLQEAVRLAGKLQEDVAKLFPNSSPAPEIDLSKLTFDEKMALGEANSAALLKMAYEINPHVALDGMERELGDHTASQDVADEVISRLRA